MYTELFYLTPALSQKERQDSGMFIVVVTVLIAFQNMEKSSSR